MPVNTTLKIKIMLCHVYDFMATPVTPTHGVSFYTSQISFLFFLLFFEERPLSAEAGCKHSSSTRAQHDRESSRPPEPVGKGAGGCHERSIHLGVKVRQSGRCFDRDTRTLR